MLYKTCKYVFATTSILYLLTLFFASYIGVYLTYVAIPVILVSGLLTYWLEPEEKKSIKERTPEERLKEVEKEIDELD